MVDREHKEKQAYSWVTQCEDYIRTVHYSDFSLVRCKLDWSTRRRSSRGGWYNGPGINIAMHLYTRKLGLYRQYEYPSFDSDPVIGGFYSTEASHALGMVICHEMAHAVQYYRDRVLNIKIDRPHGESFKNPYRELRINILNPCLPPQEKLKQEYHKPLC